ncbi:hypothetical protein E2C01_012608 [Portunus trituberculatus]|uniref:Uncharacterized protein n=1 Tax=Portunus trituberculatus TaxID=210409 RepID=A0A5B7DE59_PORTR|nr:hypothetical protein [Portunus trituberculatus]
MHGNHLTMVTATSLQSPSTGLSNPNYKGFFSTKGATSFSFVDPAASLPGSVLKARVRARAASLTMTACSEPSIRTRGAMQPAVTSDVTTPALPSQFLMIQASRRLASPCTPGWSVVLHQPTSRPTTASSPPTCMFKQVPVTPTHFYPECTACHCAHLGYEGRFVFLGNTEVTESRKECMLEASKPLHQLLVNWTRASTVHNAHAVIYG